MYDTVRFDFDLVFCYQTKVFLVVQVILGLGGMRCESLNASVSEYNYCIEGAQSYLFNFFFKLTEILLSQESSYFSRNPCQILQLKIVPFGRY